MSAALLVLCIAVGLAAYVSVIRPLLRAFHVL
jgi:hypothetical protein